MDFDLGNLVAYDTNAVDVEALRKNANAYLKGLARDGTQLLLNQIFALPTETSLDGVFAKLPESTSILPRAKPVRSSFHRILCELKTGLSLTRLNSILGTWCRFQKTNLLHDGKNSPRSKVFRRLRKHGKYTMTAFKTTSQDGDTRVPTLLRTIGLRRFLITLVCMLHTPRKMRPGMQVFDRFGAVDPMEDQYEKAREEKKERITKNKTQQRRNAQEQAATTAGQNPRDVRKAELRKKILESKGSTASMGRFDKQLKNEDAVKVKRDKRKFESNTKDAATEKEGAMNVAKKVLKGEDGKLINMTTVRIGKSLTSQVFDC